mgnify:FL=1
MPLPKKYRLTSKKDFKDVFTKGKTVKNSFFYCRILKNSIGYARIAIVVPNKTVKSSVSRNRIRRLVSEALKDFKFQFYPLDIVIVWSGDIVNKLHKEIKSEIDKVINKIISQ